MDFIELRRAVIKKDFGNMNDMQFNAVTTVKGPLLVLAGAGSGKTTVLVNRIANMVKYGNAYNSAFVPNVSDEAVKMGEDFLDGKTDSVPDGVFGVDVVRPWEILAITFTNKAAGELKERIAKKLGERADDIWAGTFHSVCGKILRRNAAVLGFTSHFTIYDTDDQRRLMKEIMKQNRIDDKLLPHKSVLSAISSAKDMLISPSEYKKTAGGDYRKQAIGELYEIYQKRLQNADAMDFDDMIVNTVRLLESNDDILDYYGNKFKYIMVDEYQDTNHAQYVLVSLLASKHNNLCVVGDDDQSIYKFRGATIENILNFEDEYANAVTIRLEQNYRSTSNILNAANGVIKNNTGRKGKTLWTDKGVGSKVEIYTADDERGEARYVAEKILENVRKGDSFSDHAVLYRMNAQSNALENVFARSGISYKVIGGFRFFERKEIKDILAYLQVINNNRDNVRLRRIVNEPKRGIGDTTIGNALEIAEQLGISLFEVFKRADEFTGTSRAAAKLKNFCDIIDELTNAAEEMPMSELFELMLDKTGYRQALIDEGEEAADRLDNVKEFSTNILQYELENDEPTLSAFLEEIALVSDIDSMNENDDSVILMTVHSAKGLEFNNVFIVGMEDGIFPGNQSIYCGPDEIEEERRLCYVAITRARRNLYITNASTRMIFGMTNRNRQSRFICEIPSECCEIKSSGLNFVMKSRDISQARQNPAPKRAAFASSFVAGSGVSAAASEKTVYSVGQRVEHKTFGQGMIVSTVPMGNDTMLEIAFDSVGTKKLMSNFAKLKIL